MSIRTLANDTIIYGLGSFILKAVQIIILPLILFYLKKDEFGRLDFFLNIKNICLILYGWGILTAIFKYSKDDIIQNTAAFNGFLVIITISLFFSMTYIVLFFFVSHVSTYWKDLLIMHITSIFGALLTIPLGVFRQKRMPIRYILINFYYMSIFIVCSYMFLKLTNLNYRAIMWAHLLASITAFLIGAVSIQKHIYIKFCRRQYIKMLRFGFSILLNSIAFMLILGVTRFIIKMKGTFENVGIMGMSQKLSLIVGALIISPFTLAWLPYVTANADSERFIETVNRVYRIYVWLSLFACFTIEVILKDILLLIKNTEYLEAIQYVLPFSLSYFAQGLYYIFAAGIFLSGNTKNYRNVAVLGIITNIALYAIAWRHISISVVSYITLVSFLIIALISYLYGNKVIKIQIFQRDNIKVYFLYGMLFTIIKYIPSNDSFLINIFMVKIIIILCIFIGFILWEMTKSNGYFSTKVLFGNK